MTVSTWGAGGTPAPRGADGLVNRMIYRGRVGGIGEFRCPAGSRAWEEENRIGDLATIAFARQAVGIANGRGEAVVATPNEAMLYNAHQPYRRKLIDGDGDRCEFFVMEAGLVREVVAAHDPQSAEDAEKPIRWGSARASAGVYMGQRVLYHHVRAAQRLVDAGELGSVAEGVDGLLIDECMINIADSLIGAAARERGTTARREATGRDHRVWIEGARDYLARNFRRALTLEDVAGAVGLSVFHLCRLFKARAGTTVHAYVRSLRARASLEMIGESGVAIGEIASGLGFCNQSHFTRAFGHEFGVTPTQVRRALREGIADRELLGGRGSDGVTE